MDDRGIRTHYKERCWKSFKERLLDKYDCDLYISTSNAPGENGDFEKLKKFYPDAKINYVTKMSDIHGGPAITDKTMIQGIIGNEIEVQNLTAYRFLDAKRMMAENGKK